MTIPPPFPKAVSASPSLISAVLAAVAALPFFIHLCSEYSATPPDALKAVGYFFIALYCAVFGVFAFGFIRPLFSIRQARREPWRLAMLIASVAVSAAILTLMIVHHPG